MKKPIEKHQPPYGALVHGYVRFVVASQERMLDTLPPELLRTEKDGTIFLAELLLLRFTLLIWWLSQIPGFSFATAREISVNAIADVMDTMLPQPERKRLSEALLDGAVDYFNWNAIGDGMDEASMAEHLCAHLAGRLADEGVEHVDALSDVARKVTELDGVWIRKEEQRYDLDGEPKPNQTLMQEAAEANPHAQANGIGTEPGVNPVASMLLPLSRGLRAMLAIIIASALLYAFYWFQLRPASIRQDCQRAISTDNSGLVYQLYGGEGSGDYHYHQCLASHGITN